MYEKLSTRELILKVNEASENWRLEFDLFDSIFSSLCSRLKIPRVIRSRHAPGRFKLCYYIRNVFT